MSTAQPSTDIVRIYMRPWGTNGWYPVFVADDRTEYFNDSEPDGAYGWTLFWSRSADSRALALAHKETPDDHE